MEQWPGEYRSTNVPQYQCTPSYAAAPCKHEKPQKDLKAHSRPPSGLGLHYPSTAGTGLRAPGDSTSGNIHDLIDPKLFALRTAPKIVCHSTRTRTGTHGHADTRTQTRAHTDTRPHPSARSPPVEARRVLFQHVRIDMDGWQGGISSEVLREYFVSPSKSRASPHKQKPLNSGGKGQGSSSRPKRPRSKRAGSVRCNTEAVRCCCNRVSRRATCCAALQRGASFGVAGGCWLGRRAVGPVG
jgi:hypothetical protein